MRNVKQHLKLRDVIKNILLLFIGILGLSFQNNKNSSSPTDLAHEIFRCISKNDKKDFVKLIATTSDLEKTTDELQLDSIQKNSLRKELINKFESQRAQNEKTFLQTFDLVFKDLNYSKWKITEIKPETNKLKLGIELSELSINYLTKKKTRTLKVKIIKTVNGWKMLEKIRRIEQPTDE